MTTAANTAPWKFSASQMSSFALCQRRWAWKYIVGLEDPAGPAAALGQRVHKVLERWFKEGIPPNRHTAEGKIALPGLEYLPLPSPYLAVERYFHVQINGLHYHGYMDLDFMTAEGPWVVDHKTTGDFAWQKSEDDLRHDIQAVLYGKVGLDRHKTDTATLMWLYYRTRGAPKAQPTIWCPKRSEVEAAFGVIDDLAREIDRVRLTVVNPLDLPPEPHACEAYNGCPYVERCGMTANERIKAIMAQTEKKQTVADKMRARAGASGSSTPSLARPVATPDMNPPEQPSEEEALSPTPPAVDDPKAGKKTTKKTSKKKSKKRSSRRDPFAAARAKKGDGTGSEAASEPASEPSSEATTDAEDKGQPEAVTPPVAVAPAETEAASASEPATQTTTEPPAEDKPKRTRAKSKSKATVIAVADRQTAFVLLHMAALLGGGHSDQINAAQQAFATFETLFDND